MWNAIRSDLKEFVTSVADDGNTVLDKIDTKIKDIDNADESKLTSNDDSSDLDTSNDISLDLDTAQLVAGDDYVGNSSGYEATGIISDSSDEAIRRMGLEETYSAPLLKDESNGAKLREENMECMASMDVKNDTIDSLNTNDEVDNNEGEKDEEGGEEQTEVKSKMLSEKIKDEISDEDEDEDEDEDADADEEKEIKLFLKSFDIQEYTEEISEILVSHPDTVGLFFEKLVPVVVTYEQFWQRHFYHCDVERIQKEWDENDERVRLERQEMIENGVKSVKNIWGGAMKAFQGVGNQKQETKKASIYEKYQAEVKEQQRVMAGSGANSPTTSEMNENKGMGLGFFTSGRPPFAMDTAGSGDDDEEYIVDGNRGNEEDEEDEEFGWGSDEESEEDDEVNSGSESGRNEETSEDEIVFGAPISDPSDVSKELETVREELARVRNERDKLQATVHNQSTELSQMQNRDDSTVNNIPASCNDEIERLKITVFEKNSELAALKASLHDTSMDDKGQVTREVSAEEIESMTVKLSAKDNEQNQLRLELNKVVSAKGQADSKLEEYSTALNEANEQVNRLSIELEDSKKLVKQQTTKVEELKIIVDDTKQASEATQENQMLSEKSMKELTSRVKEFESSSNTNSGELVSRLKAELEETKAELEKQRSNFADNVAAEIKKIQEEHTKTVAKPSSISPETSLSSSVVNVSTQPVEHTIDNVNNGEDDWGDSWSEGDDD